MLFTIAIISCFGYHFLSSLTRSGSILSKASDICCFARSFGVISFGLTSGVASAVSTNVTFFLVFAAVGHFTVGSFAIIIW